MVLRNLAPVILVVFFVLQIAASFTAASQSFFPGLVLRKTAQWFNFSALGALLGSYGFREHDWYTVASAMITSKS